MKVKVLHLTKKGFNEFPFYDRDDQLPYIRENMDNENIYTHVADLDIYPDSDDNILDVAYRCTQNLDFNWAQEAQNYENNHIYKIDAKSSSIGDVFVTPQGTFMVHNWGFKNVNPQG